MFIQGLELLLLFEAVSIEQRKMSVFGKIWRSFKSKSPLGDENTPALLNDLQTSYTPLSLLHKGDPAELSDAQVDENEQYMRGCLLERIRNIKALLAGQGVHWPESLAGIDHEPLVLATREWAKVQWPDDCLHRGHEGGCFVSNRIV